MKRLRMGAKMGFLEKKHEIGRKLHDFLDKQGIKSKKDLKKSLKLFMEQHNKEMEQVNKRLGRGLGEVIHEAENLIEAENYEKALKVCNKILKAHPGCEEALLMKAECLFHLAKPDQALACLKTVLEINPNSDQAHFQFATIMFAMRELKTALNAVNESLKIDSNSFDSLILKAQILYQLNDDSYKDCVEKARKVDAKRAENFMKKYWIKEKWS